MADQMNNQVDARDEDGSDSDDEVQVELIVEEEMGEVI